MSPEFVLELSRIAMFPEKAKDLIRTIGLEATTILINAWGGQEFPVPMVIGGANKHGTRRWLQIVELIGEECAAAMVREYGGEKVAIPNLNKVRWFYIQEAIRIEYDKLIVKGLSSPDAVFELGIRYKVNGRSIERIIKQPSIGIQIQAENVGHIGFTRQYMESLK